jgi:hypothetical protein
MHLRHWLSAFGYPSGVTPSGLFSFYQSFLLFFYFNSSESLGRMQMRLSVCVPATSQSRPPVQYLFESSDRAFFFYLDSVRHGQHSSKHGFYMASRAAPFRPCGLPVVPRFSLVGSKYNTRPSRRRRRSGLNKLGPGLAVSLSLSSLRPYCLRHDEAEDMTT